MAQFSHADFGGMSQWSSGMTMVGDMFNDGLKAKLNAIAGELSSYLRDHPTEQRRDETLVSYRSSGTAQARSWWPEELGNPSSVGSQNDMRYAVFPEKRRLVIDDHGRTKIYDTGDHHISGVLRSEHGLDPHLCQPAWRCPRFRSCGRGSKTLTARLPGNRAVSGAVSPPSPLRRRAEQPQTPTPVSCAMLIELRRVPDMPIARWASRQPVKESSAVTVRYRLGCDLSYEVKTPTVFIFNLEVAKLLRHHDLTSGSRSRPTCRDEPILFPTSRIVTSASRPRRAR